VISVTLVTCWFCCGHLFSAEPCEFGTVPQSHGHRPCGFVLDEELWDMGCVSLYGLIPAEPQVHAARSHTHRREPFTASSRLAGRRPQVGLYCSHLRHCPPGHAPTIQEGAPPTQAVLMKLNVAFFKLEHFWKCVYWKAVIGQLGCIVLPLLKASSPKWACWAPWGSAVRR